MIELWSPIDSLSNQTVIHFSQPLQYPQMSQSEVKAINLDTFHKLSPTKKAQNEEEKKRREAVELDRYKRL